MIVGDVKALLWQEQTQDIITAARMKNLMYMVKQWEALEWIIRRRQALSGVQRGKDRQD